MKNKIIEYGNDALFEVGIAKLDPELVEIIGKLHFRTSYGQNALKHSIEVAHLAGVLAGELGENVALAKRAGLLHDIGKAIDHEMEGSHVDIGVSIAKKYKENDVVINSIASHHGDEEAKSVIAVLVAIADALSASRPGARNDSLENYLKRLEQLESVANNIEGIEKTYAVQAGRELRVIVKPEQVDDLTAHKIARDVKEKIESTMQYPGTIKTEYIIFFKFSFPTFFSIKIPEIIIASTNILYPQTLIVISEIPAPTIFVFKVSFRLINCPKTTLYVFKNTYAEIVNIIKNAFNFNCFINLLFLNISLSIPDKYILKTAI